MEFNERQIPQEEPKIPEKKGKRVCAYCGKELGEAGSEENTHTICPECRAKYKKGDPAFIEALRKRDNAATEQVEKMKQDLAKERINIIENPAFTHENKIQKLKDDGFIRSQLLIKVTEATAPAELEEICRTLHLIFNIKE